MSNPWSGGFGRSPNPAGVPTTYTRGPLRQAFGMGGKATHEVTPEEREKYTTKNSSRRTRNSLKPIDKTQGSGMKDGPNLWKNAKPKPPPTWPNKDPGWPKP